jgi:hypothetical protein
VVLTSLQALVRLASLRWLGVFVCALALLCTTTTASASVRAHAHPQTKTRVWGFELSPPTRIGALPPLSLGTHPGFSRLQLRLSIRPAPLWSWPGNNPFAWADPSGRGPVGRFFGTVVGGLVGIQFGAVAGALIGGGATIETGPGVVVGVTGGALAGTIAGGIGVGILGGNAGDAFEDALTGIFLAKAKTGGGRGRFRRARDASDQLEDITEAQAAKRKQGRGCEIESTKKSEQRDKNALRRIENEDDANKEFGDDD